jgi:hypothetical protein
MLFSAAYGSPEIEFFCFVTKRNFGEISPKYCFANSVFRFVSAKFRPKIRRNETKFYYINIFIYVRESV